MMTRGRKTGSRKTRHRRLESGKSGCREDWSREDRKQRRPKAGKTGSREEQEAGKTEGRMAWSRKTNKQFENVYLVYLFTLHIFLDIAP